MALQEMKVHQVTIVPNVESGILARYFTEDFLLMLDKESHRVLDNLNRTVKKMFEQL